MRSVFSAVLLGSLLLGSTTVFSQSMKELDTSKPYPHQQCVVPLPESLGKNLSENFHPVYEWFDSENPNVLVMVMESNKSVKDSSGKIDFKGVFVISTEFKNFPEDTTVVSACIKASGGTPDGIMDDLKKAYEDKPKTDDKSAPTAPVSPSPVDPNEKATGVITPKNDDDGL